MCADLIMFKIWGICINKPLTFPQIGVREPQRSVRSLKMIKVYFVTVANLIGNDNKTFFKTIKQISLLQL